MSEDTNPTAEDDFPEVLARARAKARGMKLTPRSGAAPPRYAERSDEEFRELLERIQSNARRDPRPEPAPAAREVRSAAETRCEWYIPPRHRRDLLRLCPNPVAAQGFPAGRCECSPWRHYVAQNESQTAAFEMATHWVEETVAGRAPCLALVGAVGVGKSHLLYGAIRELNLTHDLNASASGWMELADLIRRTKFRGNDEAAHAKAVYERDRLQRAKALGIDELRPTSTSDYDPTELSQLMTRAYREMQALFVTSNAADRKLAEIIGLAATSRLVQVVVTGPDYRQHAGEASRTLRAI